MLVPSHNSSPSPWHKCCFLIVCWCFTFNSMHFTLDFYVIKGNVRTLDFGCVCVHLHFLRTPAAHATLVYLIFCMYSLTVWKAKLRLGSVKRCSQWLAEEMAAPACSSPCCRILPAELPAMLSLGNPRCRGQEMSLLLVPDTTLCVVLSAALSLTLLATLEVSLL